MKVVMIAECPPEIAANDPSRFFQRVSALDCDVIKCYDAESVYKHAEWADVILLTTEGSSWPSFWSEVAGYVDLLEKFVGVFHADSYKTIWQPGREQITIGAIFPSQYTAYQQHAYEHDYDDAFHVLWSPCCVDVQDTGVEKDIDVLFWGNPGRTTYPFRNYMLQELVPYSFEEGIEKPLIVSKLRLPPEQSDKHQSVYARLPYRNVGFWGPPLYPLLERAKICLSGPAFCHVPIAQYFQNAACGVVSLTVDFGDREALGFEHGENIWITTEEKFIADLAFLLQHDDLVTEMSARARQLVADRHTVRKRADELETFLQEVIV